MCNAAPGTDPGRPVVEHQFAASSAHNRKMWDQVCPATLFQLINASWVRVGTSNCDHIVVARACRSEITMCESTTLIENLVAWRRGPLILRKEMHGNGTECRTPVPST